MVAERGNGQKTGTVTKNDRDAFRGMLATPAAPNVLTAALFFSLSALIVPFADNVYISIGYCLIAALFYYLHCRSLFAMLGLLVPVLALWSLTGSFVLAVPFLALVLGGSAGALVLIHRHDARRDWYVFAVLLLLYGSATLITGDPVRGLLTLLPLVLTVTLAACVWFFTDQTEAVIIAAVVLGVTLLMAGIVTLAVMGQLHGNVLAAFAERIYGQIVAFLADARALYAEAGLSLGITDEVIANTASVVVNLLPGIFGVVLTVTAFLAWRTLLRLLLASGTLPRIPIRLAALRISTLSAVIFALSYLAALFSNSDHLTPAGVVLQNLSMILEPGLALIGFGALIGRGARSCLSVVLVFGLLFVLWSNPGTGIALVAFYGVFQVLMARFFPPSDKKGEP